MSTDERLAVLRALPHPREGIYRRADLHRALTQAQHLAALARRDAQIDRCPRCGQWQMHPQPGESARRNLPARRRPAPHHCPDPFAALGAQPS